MTPDDRWGKGWIKGEEMCAGRGRRWRVVAHSVLAAEGGSALFVCLDLARLRTVCTWACTHEGADVCVRVRVC